LANSDQNRDVNRWTQLHKGSEKGLWLRPSKTVCIMRFTSKYIIM